MGLYTPDMIAIISRGRHGTRAYLSSFMARIMLLATDQSFYFDNRALATESDNHVPVK